MAELPRPTVGVKVISSSEAGEGDGVAAGFCEEAGDIPGVRATGEFAVFLTAADLLGDGFKLAEGFAEELKLADGLAEELNKL